MAETNTEIVKENKEEKRVIYTSEIVLYSIFGTIWLFGFVLGILGICAYNIGKLSNNPLYQFETNLGAFLGWDGICDLRIVGTVIMLISMVILLIIIYVYSVKVKEQLATERREAERRRILMDDLELDESDLPSAKKNQASTSEENKTE